MKLKKTPGKVMSVLSLFGLGIMFAVFVFLCFSVWSSSVWLAVLCGVCALMCLLVPAKLLSSYEFTPKKEEEPVAPEEE